MEILRDEVGFRAAYAAKKEHLVIGLMSGTSLDGVDAALTRIATDSSGRISKVELLRHLYLPYSDALRSLVAGLCSIERSRIDDLTVAHFGLSEWYAESVLRVLKGSGLPAEAVDALVLHGQTVWHAPVARSFPGPGGVDLPVTATFQIGSAAVLRERTGIPVVSDLRSRDMAAGGEGAPLAPYIDAILYGSPTEGRVVQNIGGIGNATLVPAGADPSGVLAFDTGPGNMIMDAVAAAVTGGRERYDPEGSIAARGRVCEAMVAERMKDPYFSREPPKSTGREVYGAAYAAEFMRDGRSRGLSDEDLAATATAFTAESIAAAYRDFILPRASVGKVFVAGGGARNPTLVSMIRERLGSAGADAGIEVGTAAAAGLPDEAREAVAFAVLGHESLMGRPANLPAVTGARAPVVLGQITL